jgi:hypothetical protein
MTDAEHEDLRKVVATARAAALDLVFHKGLYSYIKTDDRTGSNAETLIREAKLGTFDCYCIRCQKETPFIISPLSIKSTGGGLRDGNALAQPPHIFGLRAVCQRDLTTYSYAFKEVDKRIVKIGQHPSMADIAFGELKGIDKGLDQTDRAELGKALGLFSHDAALGAFTYLRRVFERLISRAHQRQADRGNPVEGFATKRMDEKIAALSGELPERVVRNSAVFSILSLGIHELSDEKCKVIFPLMKAIIFQMLEQEEHQRREAIAERETESAFQALLSSTASAVSAEPE